MNMLKNVVLSLALLLVLVTVTFAAEVAFLTPGSNCTGMGIYALNASDLQEAIDMASQGDTVVICQNTTVAANPNVVHIASQIFVNKSGIEIVGSSNGTDRVVL